MTEPILTVENLTKWFPVKRSLRQVLRGERTWVRAVDGVSFSVNKGEIFGLVGESGCGKTTTGKLIMKLLEITDGKLTVKGRDATHVRGSALAEHRRDVQMIFQDPYSSMNPRFTIRDVLMEPLEIHKVGKSESERDAWVREILQEVKLSPPDEFLVRHPHMLSGGQRQRAATARTLMLNPSIIVADEPVSMIDLSTRAEILYMMKQLQREMGLTYIYVTHDLSTARYFVDRLAVMYLGRIIEMGRGGTVIDEALHPYTKALIGAVCEPVAGRVNQDKDVPIKGEIPAATNIPPGCRFHPRCLYAVRECWEEEEPTLVDVGGGHFVACRRYDEIRRLGPAARTSEASLGVRRKNASA
ncbi:MAG: ABC transporter ATP-binding protein [Candidatus Bipolaricaulota bacterium]